MTNKMDPFDLKNLALPSETVRERRAVVPRKIQKRQRHWVKVPWFWVEGLSGCTNKTCLLALHILYLNWKCKGGPIKLPNGMLKIGGISRQSKWRGLVELEKVGLVTIERRPNRSPIVRVNLPHP
jgi:hypothetical protein